MSRVFTTSLMSLMLLGSCVYRGWSSSGDALVASGAVPLQVHPDSQLSTRIAISGGMGVEYISAPDIVDFVNAAAATAGATQRLSEFKSAVQFFGALAYPLSIDWVLKGEYVYLLGSYNPDIPFRSTEFTLTVHMPSIILQYVLWDERLYNVKVGGGLGYHVASLSTKYLTVDDQLTGKGLGVVTDLEANTAFGDHVFAYLGVDIRWEFIGKLENNASGSQASQYAVVTLPTGNAFGIGARLGFSYYF
ncbi:MAG: hypothetical protein AAB393_01700 [Bacteroidota bacterium]